MECNSMYHLCYIFLDSFCNIVAFLRYGRVCAVTRFLIASDFIRSLHMRLAWLQEIIRPKEDVFPSIFSRVCRASFLNALPTQFLLFWSEGVLLRCAPCCMPSYAAFQAETLNMLAFFTMHWKKYSSKERDRLESSFFSGLKKQETHIFIGYRVFPIRGEDTREKINACVQ